jgi:hypothetical protein
MGFEGADTWSENMSDLFDRGCSFLRRIGGFDSALKTIRQVRLLKSFMMFEKEFFFFLIT